MLGLENVYETLMAGFAMHIGIIVAIVAFLKELFQLEGSSVRVVSFIVGLIVAGVYYVSYLFPELAPYIEGGFFILVSGLVASGFYDFAQNVRSG